MNNRRRLIGTVTGNKMQKTVVVEVSRTYRHPLYHKVVRSSKMYKAHDELGCNLGDKVQIVESQPISKTKRWVVEEIVKAELREEGDLGAIVEETLLVETESDLPESVEVEAEVDLPESVEEEAEADLPESVEEE